MRNKSPKIFVYVLILAEAALLVASFAYALLGVLGFARVTVATYFFWLLSHYTINAILSLEFWRVRHLFSLRARALMLVWIGLVGMWYLPAAIYFVLTMNLNEIQLAWINFVWMWELLGVGGILVGGYSIWTLGKINDFYEKGSKVESPEGLQRETLSIPIKMGICIVVAAIFGYVIAAVQLYLFAAQPHIERVKFIVHGFATSLFVALFYYHAFDKLLVGVRRRLEESYSLNQVAARKYSHRVFATTMLIVLGSLCFVGIGGMQLFQLYTRETLKTQLTSGFDSIANPSDLQNEERKKHLILGRRGKIHLLNKDQSQISDISKSTKKIIDTSESGYIDDYAGSIKLITFRYYPAEKIKVVSVVYLEEFYHFLSILPAFGVLFAFILLLTAVVALYTSRFFTTAITSFSEAIANLSRSKHGFTFDTYSADELENLAHTLNYFINESDKLKGSLAQRVEEKTKDLQEVQKNFELQNKDLEATKRAMLNLLEDIEESKKEIETEKAKDDALLSSITEGMIAINAKGEVIHINTQAVELLGWEANEALGTHCNKIITITNEKNQEIPSSQNPLLTNIEDKKNLTTTAHTYFLRRKNGVRFPASIIVSPVKLTSKVIGILVIFRDITLEKEVDRMKSEFISLASHQLRTPLSAIKWYLEMMLDGDIGDLSSEQKELLQNVNLSNERMISLVRSLLNISRIESGRLIIDPKPTDLNGFIRSVLSEVQPRVFEKKLNLVVSYSQDIPKISVDVRLLREVFINLLTNSIKYSPLGGEITVFISKKEREIVFQVSDHGIGIPHSEQSKVFEKFFRASNVIKKETDGSGLGLYLAKVIMSASGGRIWFKSEEGMGTTFWFALPISGTSPKKGEVALDTTAKI